MVTVADLTRLLDRLYPPHLAEQWDKVGLICGDPSDEVATVAVALEATEDTVAQAIEMNADFMLVHHPLLMRGTSSVAATTDKGNIIHSLIRNGCALFAAHTNADAARGGVNDVLASLIGLVDTTVLDPHEKALDKWGFTVPEDSVEKCKDAVFSAGAGRIGNYSQCCSTYTVTGQFTPGQGANPAIGQVGQTEKLEEIRVEFVASSSARSEILRQLKKAHPYEEIAFDILPHTEPTDEGIGRVGRLAQPQTLAQLTEHIAQVLPETVWGVRAAGDPEAMISTVALCSGAGDSFLSLASKLGVDAYVTSDLRHHPVDEHLRAGGPAVIDTAHWASEFPWCEDVADKLAEECPEITTHVIDHRTDPWTISAHKKR